MYLVHFLLSLFFTFCALVDAYVQNDEQYYRTLIDLAEPRPLQYFAFCNLLFSIFYFSGKLIISLFLGKLSTGERQHIIDKLPSLVFDIVFASAIYSNSRGASTILCISLYLFFKGFQSILQDRLLVLDEDSSTFDKAKFFMLLSFITGWTLILTAIFVYSTMNEINILAFYAFEVIISLLLFLVYHYFDFLSCFTCKIFYSYYQSSLLRFKRFILELQAHLHFRS